MNTELATFGDDLEAMMGIIPASTDQSSTPSITRVTQIHKAIMGMQDVGGKQIKAMKFGQALILDHDKTSP